MRTTVPTKKLRSSRRRPTFLLTKKLVHAEESCNYSFQNLMYREQRIGPAVSVAHRKSSRSLVCADDVHERSAANPAPKMHQFSLNAKLERITDRPAAASIPHDKKNSNTDESVLATLLGRSRGVGACADAANPYANERASALTRAGGSSCGARDFN